MGKAHQIQKKRAQPESETNEVATREKMNTINRKQTPPIQSSTQTHMNLRNSAMGGQRPIPTSKSSSAFNTIFSDPF
jgi:hypothetical protein